jgi:C-terminal processing protease CtpA/Prc
VLRLPGNVGLLGLTYFSDDPEAFAALDGAMELLHGSDALVIDLRRNMGGHPALVARLLTYLFSEQVQLTSIVWREGRNEHIDEQWTLVYVPGQRFAATPVFVLTSAGTLSSMKDTGASLPHLEAAAFECLSPYDLSRIPVNLDCNMDGKKTYVAG